ncbi:class I SAM-dependent methyltransferase [Yinghuangia seranimata]|uniref:class I SAM-dependent methyltransferase n=1 Tax=Yinghuangia seranimata TaxID=408067 RepID=UPI00248BF4FB|nr:class I SAM-dependent methyltransferase [Yinghuangia seranimata]MDI2129787.1 class I SAM-dependent methyltransferase [Yinghuangia seranimata]
MGTSSQHGAGPGEITPDGCAVEFYTLLPVMGEPDIVHDAVPPGASILELGCGTGRILRPLAALGHPVLGVDESPAMLARVADLPTECAEIEGLDLGRSFDVVLLASTMLNADAELRRAFLATCRRHVVADGWVVVQRADPTWFATVEPGSRDHDGIRRVIRSVHREGPRVDVVIDYHVGDLTWTHEFSRHPVDGDELSADLGATGLAFDRWLTDDRTWFTARAIPVRSS